MWTPGVNEPQLRGKVFESSPMRRLWCRPVLNLGVAAIPPGGCNRTSLSEWIDLEQAIDPERHDLDMRKVANVARL
jgi:hypothetical protein